MQPPHTAQPFHTVQPSDTAQSAHSVPPDGGQPPGVPSRVAAAIDAAQRAGFAYSSIPQLGRLLAALAAARPGGRIAESGTGYGVGTGWLHAGLTGPATLVTVDRAAAQTAFTAETFADDPRVTVLTGEWTLLAAHAPFDLFFCDGGGKREDPQGVVDLLAPGGMLVLDDFTPGPRWPDWPPRHDGSVDELRVWYLTHPQLTTVELGLTPEQNAILATRR